MQKAESKLMDGKVVATSIYKQIKQNYQQALASGKLKRPPKLVIILIGNNEASLIYVRQKIKACEELGFECFLDHRKEAEKYDAKKVGEIINEHNNDAGVDGIIVQMPLPNEIDPADVLISVTPKKDVDGLTPLSYGQTALGANFEYYPPCTANGVVKMLEYYKVPVSGQKVVVVGAGIVAGKAVALMLMNRKATVTVCNSKTPNLADITKSADILVVAVGKAKMIKAEMVKAGAVVVDIGISRDGLEKISGDVDFDAVEPIAKLISPVPGGVGKLTVACLMENLLKAAITA
jgi:methylenetetrahydrofolate dehydrogenase (NADP+)/methenyltetrahydrofolate cyclohydrolase